MLATAVLSLYWPGMKDSIDTYVSKCIICTTVRQHHVEPPPLTTQDVHLFKPMERLVCDYYEMQGKSYHLVSDVGSGYIWSREIPGKTSAAAVTHLKSIFSQFGRPLELVSDSGPGYRLTFQETLSALGIDAVHGAQYHPQSQGLAERGVGRVKLAMQRNKAFSGQAHQDLVHALNFAATTYRGSGSPATRLLGRSVRGLLPSPPTQLSPEQLDLLRMHLARARSKATSRRKRARQEVFQPGQSVLCWDHRARQYSEPATVESSVTSDDGAPRSYCVITEAGRLRHLCSSWLIPAPENAAHETQPQGAGQGQIP